MDENKGKEDGPIQLPTPQPYPWLMMFNALGTIDDPTFYSTLEKSHHSTKIPNLRPETHFVYTASNGWLVARDKNSRFLLNFPSLEKINLPLLPWKRVRALDYFVLTAPPTAPKCTLVLFSPSRSRAVFWKPSFENWTKLRNDKASPSSLSHINACSGRIYGIAGSEHFVECSIVDDALSLKILGPRPRNQLRGPQQFRDRYNLELTHMVPSGDDIFWVQITRSTRQEKQMMFADVYKFDRANNGWIRVADIGDRVFFINPRHSFSVDFVPNPSVKRSCIYFMSVEELLCFYDMEEDEIQTCEPCPHRSTLKPLFIMVE